MSNRRYAVLVQMAMDAAEQQGRDVLGVIPCHTGLSGWGRRSTTWCLLYRAGAVQPYCVTPYYEGDSEFGNGAYFDNAEEAQKRFMQAVRREWLDAQTYEHHGEATRRV